MKNLKNLFLGYLLLVISFGYSQQPHSGGIVVPTGFKITANQPVDDRTVVTSVEDLDNLPNKYAGLICYVENSESVYYYNGTEWNIIGSDIGGYFKEITKDGEFTAEKITGGVNDGKYTFKITGDGTLEWTIGDTNYVYNLDSNDEWTFVADALGSGVERRIDAVSYGNDGQIHYWKGTETGQASYPNIPETHILKTFVTISVDGTSTPTTPSTFDPKYIFSMESGWTNLTLPSGDTKIVLGNAVASKSYRITSSTETSRVIGIINTTTSTNMFLGVDGVIIHFWNISNNDITLANMPSGTYADNGYRMEFPIEGDYTLKQGEMVTLKWYRNGTAPIFAPSYANSKFVFRSSNMSSGGATGDFIPLPGTEVGKPLTGDIEVDTSNGFVGFYSNQFGANRKIGISDDGFNTLTTANYDINAYTSLEQDLAGNYLYSFNNNVNSKINNTPQSTTITTTDIDGNKAEIVVDEYGTVRFNSVIPNDDWSGYMIYNYEEGLQLGDNNSGDRSNLVFDGINGHYNSNNWQIRKPFIDSNQSNLLFPDSGSTARRIPVSVNGNFADQQGNIEVPVGSNQDLLQTLANGNIADDDGNVGDVIRFLNINDDVYSSIRNEGGDFGLVSRNFNSNARIISSGNDWIVSSTNSSSPGLSGQLSFIPNYTDESYVQKKYVDDNFLSLTGNQTIADLKTFTTSPLVPSKTTAATNTGTSIATEAQVFTKANDNVVVKLTGNQTVAGVKTFSSSPIIPTATTTTQAVNKGQMDTALNAYVNAGTSNTTGGAFSLDKVVLRNATTGRTTTITKPNTDSADSNITIPGFGGGTKVMPISVNGVSAGPSGDINLTLDIDKFTGVTLGGSSTLLNVNFAASNPDITGYEEIEIGIQFLGKPTTTTDFYITFNSNTNPVYNSSVVDNSGTTDSFTNQSGFRFKYDSDNGFYTFKVKNYGQTGIPRIITGSGVEFGDNTTNPKTWTFGGGLHSDANITTLQIKSVDGTTNVPYMRVTVKRIF